MKQIIRRIVCTVSVLGLSLLLGSTAHAQFGGPGGMGGGGGTGGSGGPGGGGGPGGTGGPLTCIMGDGTEMDPNVTCEVTLQYNSVTQQIAECCDCENLGAEAATDPPQCIPLPPLPPPTPGYPPTRPRYCPPKCESTGSQAELQRMVGGHPMECSVPQVNQVLMPKADTDIAAGGGGGGGAGGG